MSTEAIEKQIIGIIETILKQQRLPFESVELSSVLYDGGIGLDSLCVAELSAKLEKTFGKDPYTSRLLPQTVSDLVNFYSTVDE